MLTPEDIKNLTEYQKEIFVTKDEFQEAFGELKQSIKTLQIAVDGIAKISKDDADEIASAQYRLDKVESWVSKAAPKVDVRFET